MTSLGFGFGFAGMYGGIVATGSHLPDLFRFRGRLPFRLRYSAVINYSARSVKRYATSGAAAILSLISMRAILQSVR
jgi:hypothetical protein